ncbi:kinesin-domain-containing protein [Dendrothele bispora CBS 962.96]|uniref:Kinesin-like protein n=1 Tax=Dendrothele bispora (strain CBS 962.96) TaxID=1314807 RepID=A0A4S8LQF1_DENBC|nr:kinesin-domain-containing protein [Dendrothele bispora CBS 962.96]
MSDKPKTTRSTTRTKTQTTPAPTTTRTTRAKAANATKSSTVAVPPSLPPPPPPKKAVARKPLGNRGNTEVSENTSKPPSKATVGRKAAKVPIALDNEREPIMAFLRIRPALSDDDSATSPYLTQLSDNTVRMADPQDHHNLASKFRSSNITPSSTYTFSHVFPPTTTQSDFFTKTTLPLVRDALEGQNGLLFTYGVTNSGKTYTVQGGTVEGSAGIVPRTLDVIFNSVDGLQGDSKYRPVRLHGVELADPSDSRPPPVTAEPGLESVLDQMNTLSLNDQDIDSTSIKLDRNYEYSIWLSYAEIYNEKIYDLLDSVKDPHGTRVNTIPQSNSSSSLVLARAALAVKPSPASDGQDSGVSGKYIAGLPWSTHRRVFGTLANRESSRSHGMVILKIVRCHRGEKNDPTAVQISRLTLVDLAGSERTKHTHTTGDRLKEAGNINKSLMVLGQCLDTLRSNQKRLAVSLSQEGKGEEGRMDTRDVRKGLAIVPFRHSKLTEVLMDYFVGDGRTVVIVNVNPYDTGYDENSHVMKFAALAREVYITPAPAPVQRAPSILGPGKLQGKLIKQLGPLTLKDPDVIPKPFKRKVTLSMGGPGGGRKKSETVVEVLEVDETHEGDSVGEDEDDLAINPFVDELFDEIEYLRLQLFEAEMRCAIVEAETREEVMREMEERMGNMEEMYRRRLMKSIEQNEMKTDAKIDMLHQSGLFGSPVKKPSRPVEQDLSEEEEDEVDRSLVSETSEDEETEGHSSSGEEFDFGSVQGEDDDDESVLNGSPLASKGKAPAKRQSTAPQEIRESRTFIPDGPMLSSDTEDAEMTDEDESVAPSVDEEETETEEEESDDEDEYVPPAPEPKSGSSKKARVPSPPPTHKMISGEGKQARLLTSKTRVSVLEQEMNDMVIDDAEAKPVRTSSTGTKKPRRQLGKAPIVRADDMEDVAMAIDKKIARSGGGANVKRLTRLS